jgi:hypothetical protein
MNIEFLVFVNVVADPFEYDEFEESLDYGGFGRNEDASGLVAGVGGPFFRSRNIEDIFPVRDRRQDFEGFREGARLVAGENLANPRRC